jgi:hypothetical protein
VRENKWPNENIGFIDEQQKQKCGFVGVHGLNMTLKHSPHIMNEFNSKIYNSTSVPYRHGGGTPAPPPEVIAGPFKCGGAAVVLG